MKIAYLVNQYPHVSHTFIRREIAALEERGLAIERYSVRPPPAELIDAADRAEAEKTWVILPCHWRLIAAVLAVAVQHPGRWFRAATTTLRLARRSPGGRLRHCAYLAEACFLVGELRRRGVRHLHAHFGTNPAAVALLTRILGGPPYSFTVHGPEEFDRPEALSLGEKVAGSAFAVAISSFGRSQLFRWSQAGNWEKIHVIRCGLDAGFRNGPATPVPDNRRLVCVGRLCEQKGQLLLLRAVAQLVAAFPGLEIILAGGGPMRGEIESMARRLGIEHIVCVTGWVTNAEVRALIRSSRALVLPSFAEGLPVVLMEALALGRPVLTTYVAGIPELVHDGVNGWLVPAGSEEALTGAVRRVLQTAPDELSRMGAAGAAAVHQMHDAATEAARLADLFRKSC